MAISISEQRRQARQRRHRRVRRRLAGTAGRPRLAVFRSLRHIYVQVIDDEARHTLLAASSRDLPAVAASDRPSKTAQAAVLGRLVADRARAMGVATVVFDRGGYRFHGRVRALAEAAREAGLRF